ncbi:MAG: Alkanesulfonate monooxygenase SsuD/methylene tetrahydromethanopterin reductase-like [Caulobacteraceae bacterium]|nr:Alkanesulfonate monooxygenase SsuD/methylene tetrahydromethanopterin reductase-like [Caulobacteraceae bacterium]
MTRMPAIGLAASSGRRLQVIELAKEAEKRGFEGIYCPTAGGTDCLALCQAIAQATHTIHVGTSIQPIYFRLPAELARGAAFIHEVSGGRFRLGIGVTHAPVHAAHGLNVGKPLGDMRAYVAAMRTAEATTGPLPPIVLATLRTKMLALAAEIGDGAVWANGSRSYMPTQLKTIPQEKREAGFFLGDMVPTVIDADEAAAKAVLKKTLALYCRLPNYRNYWKEAGYVEEMAAIEAAIAAGDFASLPGLMTDRWLADNCLFGSPTKVRDGVEAWFDAGITTPIIVPSSTSGGQAKAVAELFAIFE